MSLLQTITALTWQMARYDAVLLALRWTRNFGLLAK